MITVDIDDVALVQFDAVSKEVRCTVAFTLETGTTDPATGVYAAADTTVLQVYSTTVRGETGAEMVEDLHRQLAEAAMGLERQRRRDRERWEAFTVPDPLKPAFYDPRTHELPEDV